MPETDTEVVQLLPFGTQLQDATPQPYPCSPDPKNRNPLCMVILAQYKFTLKTYCSKGERLLGKETNNFQFHDTMLDPNTSIM